MQYRSTISILQDLSGDLPSYLGEISEPRPARTRPGSREYGSIGAFMMSPKRATESLGYGMGPHPVAHERG